MDDKTKHYARCGQNTKTYLYFTDLENGTENASPRDSLGLPTMLRKSE
jgi:hypothetical protein